MKIILKNGVVIEDATEETVRLVSHMHIQNPKVESIQFIKVKPKNRKVGSRSCLAWTEKEDQFLTDNVKDMTYKQIARQLGRSEKGVQIHYHRRKYNLDGHNRPILN